jgi:outer membrane protein OmpA-like peptidoglycan-associated protein
MTISAYLIKQHTCRHKAAMKLLLPLLLLTASLTAKATVWQNSDPNIAHDYVMTINRSAMAVVDSNVVVSIQLTAIQDIPTLQSVVLAPVLVDTVSQRELELPLIFLNSRNQQIYFERCLAQDYPDAIALRKKNGKNLDIDYVRTVKYEPWMDRAVLKLRKQSCACSNMKPRGELTVARFDREKEAPVIQLFPVYIVPPADNSVKVREVRGSAFLCFELNKWDIKPDYMTNPTELEKIHNSVNLVRNDSDVTIRQMTIEGFASPEGPFAHNLMLSENRTEALRNYLIATNIGRGINIRATGGGENWQGFMAYLAEHTSIPQYNQILSIANSSLAPDEKERQMRRNAPQGFAYVLENVFPALRCTNYTVEYTVRPFTLEESERVFETRPINLNLNEIYRLAENYASDQDRYNSIIRRAYLLYPNDTYINLTMAYLAIKRGEADEAAEYLSKVEDCPQKTMNEGLVAYLRGDIDTAIRLVEQAKRSGVAKAEEQLQEFAKLRQN